MTSSADYIASEDIVRWLQYFPDEEHGVFEQQDAGYQETEFVVTGVWDPPVSRHHIDMQTAAQPQADSPILVYA